MEHRIPFVGLACVFALGCGGGGGNNGNLDFPTGGGGGGGKRPPSPYHAELIPPGTGWFCFSRPNEKDGKPFSFCSRQAPICASLHDEDAQKYSGVTPCEPVTTAWCHTYRTSQGKDMPVCVPTEAECVEEVDLFLHGKTPSSLCRTEP